MLDPVPLCSNDDLRVSALKSYSILDTPPEVAFDGLTWLAKMVLNTPMAALSLVDANRQWFKSRHGIDFQETPRSVSFCTHAVAAEQPFIVPDAHDDPRFANSPMVSGPPYVRFYLGMPLVTRERFVLGALCVYDTEPRAFVSADQLNAMNVLARLAVESIELRRVAETDGLTNMLTRTALSRAASIETRRARRHHRPLVCLVLDIDHFKLINDSYGHAVGDYVLRNVAATLRQNLRPHDLVGRIGGEEFAVLLPETDLDGAIATAHRLRMAIFNTPVQVAGTELQLTASFGLADCRQGAVDFDAALVQADLAMYQSKKSGRNRVTCATEALHHPMATTA